MTYYLCPCCRALCHPSAWGRPYYWCGPCGKNYDVDEMIEVTQ